GISYKVGYAMAIALRYVPDVQADFTKIRHAQEARGIEMSSKASLLKRLKSMASIIFPLIFSSMDRIDVVSNAMELRGFGKKKTRTWYMGKPLARNDYLTIAFVICFVIVSMVITFYDGNRFYNPFQ
ncbi:MAG TPA: energy-coupling factor transporter transmembrane protein EcfT, partial [Candidatus Eisenbergiella merdipullorum]|nr:energy-coupling factor transporter transmembrane protein EcfT [Candidatus Eisenbergiella merdipullorum]